MLLEYCTHCSISMLLTATEHDLSCSGPILLKSKLLISHGSLYIRTVSISLYIRTVSISLPSKDRALLSTCFGFFSIPTFASLQATRPTLVERGSSHCGKKSLRKEKLVHKYVMGKMIYLRINP